MKPLLKKELPFFLKRFDNFRDCEFRSLNILSSSTIELTFAVQDKNRDFDWISLTLEFNNIKDARLLQDKQIPLIDMSDGITLIVDDSKFAFAISECYNLSSILNSSLYIIAETIKYQEGEF